jgi:RNA polymerase primary sigma factor
MKQLKIAQQITNRDSLSLEKYLVDIAREDMITADEEVALAIRIQQGDTEALERLTKANLRFVVSVAKQYQHQGLPLSDLINEGNIGLIKAAQRFDHSKGFKFISYAVWWIRQSIMQAIIDQSRLIRLPMNKAAAAHKLYKVSVTFEQHHERTPATHELEEMTEIKSSTILNLMMNQSRPVSMDAPMRDGEDMVLTDVLTDENGPAPEEAMMLESLQTDLHQVLDRLTLREAEVLKAYFGLDGDQKMTLNEIGEKYGLTRERVRQIKEHGLRRLRKSSLSKKLEAYLD